MRLQVEAFKCLISRQGHSWLTADGCKHCGWHAPHALHALRCKLVYLN
jgi:hypothetical protein